MRVTEAIPRYVSWMKAAGRSRFTIGYSNNYLVDFARFLEASGLFDLEKLTREAIESYREDLTYRVSIRGGPLHSRSQGLMLWVVKSFTRWLEDQGYFAHDPGRKVELPRKVRPLPRDILEAREMNRLLDLPDTHTLFGFRDRVVLEILYSTGIRRLELSNLKVRDLDLGSGFLRVNDGKGRKDRVVPLGRVACEVAQSYIVGIRPRILQGKDTGHLVLNRFGRRMGPEGIYGVVKRYGLRLKTKKRVSTHTLRHTCATHMLRRGAHVRHLQELLGHASLDSTQIYTRVTIADLKKIHAKYHPREKTE